MPKLRSTMALLFFLAMGLPITAQQKSSANRWQFHSINNVGLLEGQAGSAFQLQSINGVQYRSWFAGLGIGLDYYQFRGLPLFLDLRKMFRLSSNALFVYGDIGVHSNWMTDKQKTNNYIFSTQNVYNGVYVDAGGGYQINVGKTNAFLLSLGYSYKTLNGEQVDISPVYYGITPVSTYKYSMGRLSIKAGWRF